MCDDNEIFSPSHGVWNTDVDFSVEPSEPPESGVNGVGTVGGGHDDDVGPLLETVHQRQQLGDNPTLNFAVGLLSLRSNRVQLIDENYGCKIRQGMIILLDFNQRKADLSQWSSI